MLGGAAFKNMKYNSERKRKERKKKKKANESFLAQVPAKTRVTPGLTKPPRVPAAACTQRCLLSLVLTPGLERG